MTHSIFASATRFAVCCLLVCDFVWAADPPQSSGGRSYPTTGSIDRFKPAIDRLIPTEATLEVIADGFTWCEGPVWVGADATKGRPACLLFSDIPRNTIFRWTEADGITTFMNPSGYTGVDYYGLEPGSNGLTLDPDGNLVMCEHGDRRVSLLTRGGGKVTLADRFEGKRLNSPNDLIFDKQGSLYFTDPPYGLPLRYDDPRRELDFCGVYRLSPDGRLTLLTNSLDRPNGIGLSPDQKTLYVAQSDLGRPVWMAFSLGDAAADQAIGEGRVLLDAKPYLDEFPGLPDGMAVHSSGVVFGSGPGGVYVIDPAGVLLGRITTGGRVSNCTFDPDESNLYITADDQLIRVRMN